MQPSELGDFHREFLQEVLRTSEADGQFAEEAFFLLFAKHLEDAGEIDTADYAPYIGTRGLRVDGYAGHPSENDGTLTLLIADFSPEPEVAGITKTEMDAVFNRVRGFLEKSLDGAFRAGLEETSPGFGLASTIAGSWSAIRKVRLFLITNRLLSARVDTLPAGDYQGKPLVYSVWDIGRLHKFATAGRAREELVVDFGDYGGALPVLPAHMMGADYEAYLLVMPGTTLARIYDRWGARLLEQNVRVFLQAQGAVNKGIRATIDNEPTMFFAYNNGLTATAEDIEIVQSPTGTMVTSVRDLQIVNGGQTTASIYAAHLRGVDLSGVFVQVKLSVIPPAQAEEAVPKISQYANSQNKVSAADFFANHPYHLRMKAFSSTVLAPASEGTLLETKWFYERARGQYREARSGLTTAEKRRFDLEYPRRQMFTKTDLAKYLAVWECRPDVVSKGAQKNFAHFASEIGKAWTERSDAINEVYYRQSIAKAIVFHTLEALVSKQPWYDGGYRANIVAYAISKIANDVRERGAVVDFDSIWKRQGISPGLEAALLVAAERVRDVLLNPDMGSSGNVSEWAKQPACWSRVAKLRIAYPSEWAHELLSDEEQKSMERTGMKDQKILNGIQAQTEVVRAGSTTWKAVLDWGVERKLLSEKERGVLSIASMPHKLPSEQQSIVIMKAYERMVSEGCPVKVPPNK